MSKANAFTNEEYKKARSWLQEHGCWDKVKDAERSDATADGYTVIYYYWRCLDQTVETD